MASVIGAFVALLVYGLCTTAAIRSTGNATFGLPFALALGLLQLIAAVAAGLTVISLAYWLFGG